MSTENSAEDESIEWEPVARKQLSTSLRDAKFDVEDEHSALREKIESDEAVTVDDLNELRRALNRYQTVLEEDITEITDSEPFGGHALDNIRPSALE